MLQVEINCRAPLLFTIISQLFQQGRLACLSRANQDGMPLLRQVLLQFIENNSSFHAAQIIKNGKGANYLIFFYS